MFFFDNAISCTRVGNGAQSRPGPLSAFEAETPRPWSDSASYFFLQPFLFRWEKTFLVFCVVTSVPAPIATNEEPLKRMSLSGRFPSVVFDSSPNGSVFKSEYVVGCVLTNMSILFHSIRNFEKRFCRNGITI